VKIRNQLVMLLTGVAFPLVLLAGFLTYQLWQQQRLGFQQQFLERVSAVRLALDTEFRSTVSTLRTIGNGSEIPESETRVVLERRFRRLLDNQPDWTAVALTDLQGRVVMSSQRDAAQAISVLDSDSVRRALTLPQGLVLNIPSASGAPHVVLIAAAVPNERAPQGVIYAVVARTHWLEILRAYPVSKRGTLTLLDGDGSVITRTLNDLHWVGRKAPADYLARTSGAASGAFKTIGIDGTHFYSAFSRSAESGWILSTGVPQDEVDEALYQHTLTVLLVSTLGVAGAVAAAVRLGKAVSVSMLGLETSAHALANEEPIPHARLPIKEARAVREALSAAHLQLLEREASLHAALEREAVAREQSQSASQAKDHFLAMMGHELRNPLSAIAVAVDLLGNEPISVEAMRRSREIVKRQAGHLSGMINELMDVAQLDSGEIVLRSSCLDLAEVAAKVLARFEETGRCTHLQMRIEHGPAWIEADEARVELLITCLLDNACKYTPPGGTVVLEIIDNEESSVLRVRDTGVGIDSGLIDTMFNAFAQGERGIDRSQGGLGLGLTLARKLAELHGATMSAFSDGPGTGANFTVTFPRADKKPLSDAVAAHIPNDVLLTIVEDIADNREMLQMLLEAQGRRINSAADGPSGVQLILDGPSDVAVVDIGLPGFDGLEVARRVRQAPGGDRILLIALTGYGTEADRSRAMSAGFDDFLVKPFEFARFEAALASGLAAKHEKLNKET
jgi:signal transduction histidine kinase/ActR/RegA family two-component response regulator